MEEKMLCKLTSGDTVYHYNKSIIIKFSGKRAVLSTGILNGGYRENISAVLNHDAKAAPGMGCQLRAPTYEEHMKLIAEEAGLDAEHTTGIATAANMENVSIVSQNYGNLSLTAIITAGIETNGGRVGDPASYMEENERITNIPHGTINIILAIDGKLFPHTLARSFITVTEAKTAAIQELLEGSKYSTGLATGSGTDGVIVYANVESKNIYQDAGKHSKLGELIGKAVKQAVKEALEKQSGLCPEKQKSIFRRGRRYGITAERLWEDYIATNSEKQNKKLEYMEFIETLEKKEDLVSLTSLYLHLLDQWEWKLLSEKTVREHCSLLRKEISNILGLPFQNRKKKSSVIEDMIEAYIILFTQYVSENWEKKIERK